MFASKAGSPTVTEKPASRMAAIASLVDLPRTSGTVIESATVRATALPRAAVLPTVGSVRSTRPGSVRPSNVLVTGPMVKPASVRAFWASVCDCPTTCGTTIGRGPADRMRVTGAFTASSLPAAGSVRSTAPTGTASSSSGRCRDDGGQVGGLSAAVGGGRIGAGRIAGTVGRPMETISSTSDPRSCSMPAAGSVPSTRPEGTCIR